MGNGYKSGGFATFGPSLDASGDLKPTSFDPEESISFEVGMKGRFWDGSMQTNVGLFHYSMEDMQFAVYDPGPVVRNVGEIEGQGVEADLRFLPTDNWDLSLAFSYLDTEVIEDDGNICGGCVGNRVPIAPEFSAATYITYSTLMGSGKARVTFNYTWQSKQYGGYDNLATSANPSYGVAGLMASYDSEADWSVSLWVKNLTDEEFFERGHEVDGGPFSDLQTWPSRPRQAGVDFTYKF